MPKKGTKKGRVSKISKMTEEERVLLEEAQRLAEEEMKKKQEHTLNQYLKVEILLS